MSVTSNSRTQALFDSAKQSLVAGVSASARLNAAIGHPLYVERGDGCRLYDLDGKSYIDYNMSHGATFLGHNHPKIREAVEQALDMGVVCAYETEYHSKLARMICETIPAAEHVRFANSGTEATMGAIRIARTATGKKKILKFEGHFHGLHDWVMWNAHGPARTEFPTYPYVPKLVESAGVPEEISEFVYVIPWNDPDALDQALREHGNEICAVICEPVNYNTGCVLPKPGFLQLLREKTQEYDTLLIFDEVLSSFRMAAGGAQEYYGVTPDLCTIAKAVANGLPLAIIAGSKAVMGNVSPVGAAAHSGTYSGHLFSILAAIASLEIIKSPGFYDDVFAKADMLYPALQTLFYKYGIKAKVQGLGARFGIFFGVDSEVWDYQGAASIDSETMYRFIRECFERGVYFHNYGKLALGHHGFSASHSLADIDETLNRTEDALKAMTA